MVARVKKPAAKGAKKKGGWRPGSGRPRTIENRWWTPEAIQEAARKGGASPLEYMLAVMNDPNAHVKRRDMFAKLAAQYVHASLRAPTARDDERPKGKRETAQSEAEALAGEDDTYAPPAAPGNMSPRRLSVVGED